MLADLSARPPCCNSKAKLEFTASQTTLADRVCVARRHLGFVISIHALGHGRVWRSAHGGRARGDCRAVFAANSVVAWLGAATGPALEKNVFCRPAQFRYS